MCYVCGGGAGAVASGYVMVLCWRAQAVECNRMIVVRNRCLCTCSA